MTNAGGSHLLDTPERVLAFPLTGVQLIEASAGTGKTYTIANLYLRHILNGAEVGQVLVVTFTEAATQELRGRIRARLVEMLWWLDRPGQDLTTAGQSLAPDLVPDLAPTRAPDQAGPCDDFLRILLASLRTAGGEALELARRRLRLAVRSMDEAAIFTIHGFCQRVLSEFAFLSGQTFQMEVLTDDRDLSGAALADWWRRTAYPLDQGRARLLRDALGDVERLRTLVAPLLGPQPPRLRPEAQALANVLARVDALAPLIRLLALGWREEGSRLGGLLMTSPGLKRAQGTPYHPDRLTQTLAQVAAWLAAMLTTGETGQELRPPPACFEALTPQSLAKHAKKKGDPALADPYFETCGRLWEDLCALKRDLQLAALADAAAFVRVQVRAAKERAQVLGYDDLLIRLHDALRAGPPDGPDGRAGDAGGDAGGDASGDRGNALAEAVITRFPVAMIDEFQDTDPVQYGIFHRLYQHSSGTDTATSLVMIGDPKQAIYSFRGGDIFAYGRAKRDAGPQHLYSLGTNWRSTPDAIRAVNTLFGRRGTAAFVFGEAIPFAPAEPAPRAHRRLHRDRKAQTALTLWTLPCERDAEGAEKALSKEAAREIARRALAQEVAALIAEGRAGLARLAEGPEPQPGDAPLRPRDIAVLVRSHREGAAVREALAAWGVRAVSVERTPVFATEEAAALEPLFQAVLEPNDRDLARSALASPLLGLDYVGLQTMTQGETAWAEWLDTLLALREDWRRSGFMAMFQSLLRYLGARREAALGLTERRLTNLLHLGELLQQASRTQAGMDALLAWYRARRAEASGREDAGDEQQLRLESDAELVQIVTVHSAKGLEYPVVFLPDLWECRPRDAKGLVAFHEGDTPVLDAGSPDLETHLLLAERERLAEDLRLVYVALTRARCALYLVWGRAGVQNGHAGQSALGWLLHPHQDPDALLRARPDAFEGLAELQPDLDALAAAAAGSVRVLPIPQPSTIRPLAAEAAPLDLAPRRPSRPVPQEWRIASFSELTRGLEAGPTPPRAPGADDPALRFPAGSEAGSYLHALLEGMDFRREVQAQVLAQSARAASRFGLDHDRWGQDAAVWLERVTRTPLDETGLCLAWIAPERRLAELAFDFAAARVDIQALNRVLQGWSDDPLPPLPAEGFAGFVTGVIDLVFEHQGRYYLADYKSNFLGPTPQDYAPERLAAAVRAHRYDLQCLLYTLALHRYLRARRPGYRYEAHFGGACYLFLRGMRPETGPSLGVHWARPAPALVETLDQEIFRQAQAQAKTQQA